MAVMRLQMLIVPSAPLASTTSIREDGSAQVLPARALDINDIFIPKLLRRCE
jgi:hypothetical protein